MSNKKSGIKKAAKTNVKRKNKTEHELLMEMQAAQRMDHAKEVIRRVFPKLEGVETIYDAQTVVNALSGFIMPHIENYMSKIKLSELPIDLSNEDDSEIKTALELLLKELAEEPAKQLMGTLDRFGSALATFGADRFLKQPMTAITIDDIVAK